MLDWPPHAAPPSRLLFRHRSSVAGVVPDPPGRASHPGLVRALALPRALLYLGWSLADRGAVAARRRAVPFLDPRSADLARRRAARLPARSRLLCAASHRLEVEARAALVALLLRQRADAQSARVARRRHGARDVGSLDALPASRGALLGRCGAHGSAARRAAPPPPAGGFRTASLAALHRRIRTRLPDRARVSRDRLREDRQHLAHRYRH